MDVKLVVLLVCLLTILPTPGYADFLYNRISPKTPEELEALNLKCVPGRTILKIESVAEKLLDPDGTEEDDGEIETDARRVHTTFVARDDTCKICVCSVEGKDEYCSTRPAMNVNECIRMTVLKDSFDKNMPYDHERSLSYRIRRDYLWHKDEIPYSASSLCFRGVSYYTNNENANKTTIARQIRVESQLDYGSRNVCYFCVCHTSGSVPACIPRNPWFCDYYRIMRRPNYSRDRYRYLFKEDRPAYFRQLSYRIRRTMDNGIMELLDKVGDEETECVPFLSEYTDCSEGNVCTGCTKCSCSAEGQWQCQMVQECPGSGDEDEVNADTISNAYEVLFNELSNMETKPEPIEPQHKQSRLFGNYENLDEFQHIAPIVKRSVKLNKGINTHNGTVKFYNTVDEINEDTLKNTNESGTIKAKQLNGVKVPKISRRTSVTDSKNITGISDLHIDFHQPKGFDHQIVDNKIDSLLRNQEITKMIDPIKIGEVIGNHTQQSKDKDLSQLVVNELKKGSEIIGNKEMTPVSNITFTPENDTLTAMAFIAGDLFSKLWKIEKESSAESMETEVLKHEKLADLLELFKEPLTMRQELFIKNALERLSKALDKDRKLKNVSLCETLASSESIISNSSSGNQDDVIEMHTNCKNSNDSRHQHANNPSENGATEAISKIKNVLNLLKKFENVELKLNKLRNEMQSQDKKGTQDVDLVLSKDESKSLNVFGTILEKITKLLLPKNSKKAKKFMTKVKHMNLFGNSDDIRKELKQIMGINSDHLNLTSKDRLVIDYLNVFKMNPNCAFKGITQKDASLLPTVKGDTYDNISKLLNVKSMDDIVELISPSSNSDSNTRKKEKVMKDTTTEVNFQLNDDKNEYEKFNLTKHKLKTHISAIFNDLKELQNQSGKFLNENKDITNMLPCLYNLLNAAKSDAKEITKMSNGSNFNNISLIFESLRNNLIGGPVSRRKEYTILAGSTKVWERVIKNLNKQSKDTRRNYNSGLKTFEEIRQIMDNVAMSANSYKEYASLVNVPISSHLILLKVIQASVLQMVNALENTKSFMKSYIEVPADEEFVIKEFVDNAVRTINLNKRISDKLLTYKKRIHREDLSNYRFETGYKEAIRNADYNVLETPTHGRYEEQKSVEYNLGKAFSNNKFIDTAKSSSYTIGTDSSRSQTSNSKPMKIQNVDINDSNVFKFTREQILTQLIKNRVELYIRIKEAKGIKSNVDINYNLAKRIKTQLESGNYSLAKELFSVFISNTVRDANGLNLKNLFKGLSSQHGDVSKDAVYQIPQVNKKNSKNEVKFMASEGLLKQLNALKKMKF